MGTVLAKADPAIGARLAAQMNSSAGDGISFGSRTDLAATTWTALAHAVSPPGPAGARIVLSRTSGSPVYDQNWVLGFAASGAALVAHREASGGAYKNATTSALPADTPMMIAGVYDGTNLVAYADGVVPGVTAATAPTTTSSATIDVLVGAGDGLDRTLSYMDQPIGMCAFWSRPLSAAEVNSLLTDPFQFIIDPAQQILSFAAGTMPAAAAALQGSTGITFANSGALTTGIPLAGSSSLTFADSAALTTNITMAGTSALSFGLSGAIGNSAIGTAQYRFGRIRKRYEFGQITKEPT